MAERTMRKPLFVLPGYNPGLIIKGNIDINNRPSVKNQLGGTSSVYSASSDIVIGGKHYEMLYPTVIPVGGHYRVVSWQRGLQYALKTRKHLGIFDTPSHATAYARRLHRQQAQLSK